MNELTHLQARQLIHAAAVGRVSAGEQESVDRHLAACPGCRAYADDLNGLRSVLSRALRPSPDGAGPPPDLMPHVIARLRRTPMETQASAALRLAALVGLVVVLLAAANWILGRQSSLPLGGDSETPPVASPGPTNTPSPPNVEYSVVEGDTCASIAVRFNVTVQAIVGTNRLGSSCQIVVDQILKIPVAATAPFAEKTGDVQIAASFPVQAYFRVETETALTHRLAVDFCYPRNPPNGLGYLDVGPTYLSLPAADIPVSRVESGPREPRAKTERCKTAYFALPYQADLSEFTVTLQRLDSDLPEVTDCERLRAILESRQMGIVVRCILNSDLFADRPDDRLPVIVKHPESMTLEQAADFVLALRNNRDPVVGPWVFTGSLAIPAVAPSPTPEPAAPPVSLPAPPDKSGLIAFSSTYGASGKTDLYVMQPDGGGLARLTGNTWSDFDPRWSPDGRRIAFLSKRPERANLFVVDVEAALRDSDDKQVSQLTRQQEADYQPLFAWSPDGKTLAAVRFSFPGRADSWNGIRHAISLDLVNSDGSGVTPVYETIGGWAGSPRWSASGEYIALLVDEGVAAIKVSNAPGASLVRLPCTGAFDWIPGTTRLACAAAGNRLITVEADGANPTLLAQLDMDRSPDRLLWSPDGARLLLVTYDAVTARGHLFLLNASGSGLRELSTRPLVVDNAFAAMPSPAWSPDSRWIVFGYDSGSCGIGLLGIQAGAGQALSLYTCSLAPPAPDWQP